MLQPAIAPAEFRTRHAVTARLPDILAAPSQNGTFDRIVTRPGPGERVLPGSIAVSASRGTSGDDLPSGSGHALSKGAGDTFFIDTDLTPSNRPPGTRFAIGGATFVVTALAHNGVSRSSTTTAGMHASS